MKVLLAVSSLDMSYGGPAASVAALARILMKSGLKVVIWAPQTSSAGLAEAGRSGIAALREGLGTAIEWLGRPDIIHDNGIWLRHNHQLAVYARRSGIPRVLSPRGMLSPWALNHKRTKKLVAWWVYQRLDAATASRLHATSETEGEDLQRLNLPPPVDVIPNGIQVEMDQRSSRNTNLMAERTAQSRTALFIGRLYPVKGLPLLIEAWARVRPRNWNLVIAGPDEAGHRRHLESMVDSRGLQDEIIFPGAVSGTEKSAYLRAAELFVLPSLSESFGVAVAEALASGIPVITTTAAPWPAIRTVDCGWWCPPTVAGLAQALETATALTPNVLAAMGARGRRYVAKELDWGEISKRFILAYEKALHRSGP